MPQRWILLAVLPFALWGSSMVAMKLVLVHGDPWTVACLRILPAAIGMLLLLPMAGVSLVVAREDWGWLALFSLVDVSCGQGLLSAGLQTTGAGLSSILIDTQPLLVALLARQVFGETINPVGWLGLLMGLGGVACLGLPEPLLRNLWLQGPALGGLPWDGGVALLLGSAISMACGAVLCRFAARQSHVLSVTAWHLLLGGLPLLGISTWHGSTLQTLLPQDWWLMAYASGGGTALGYGLFFWFVTRRELTGFTALTFLTPVFALACSWLVQDERLEITQWIGVLLVLVAVALITRRQQLWTQNS
ncbi:MAG: membrane protein [Candidatus Synechococcus spongiarum 142]|uniref:Membrane protein n=1 Tax=Candidatus Synechococcus spongiarum 142 TaxID=1608213 RepID=A0A6N3X9G4_9SYNE|nr:MAG: membrane protein [Candidatus Synechococcus spongiarum 142]